MSFHWQKNMCKLAVMGYAWMHSYSFKHFHLVSESLKISKEASDIIYVNVHK